MQKENLSALMDGEFFSSELLTELKTQQQLSQCWQRYHLVRDALRSEVTMTIDVTQKVAQAIAQEALSPSNNDNVITLPKKSVVHRTSSWLTYCLQAGVAASVSLFIIAGVKHYQQPAAVDTVSGKDKYYIPGVATTPMIGNVSPVSFSMQENINKKWQEQSQLNQLLQNYELQRRLFSEQTFSVSGASSKASPVISHTQP